MGLNIIVDKRFFPDIAVGLEGSAPFEDKDAVFRRGKRLFFFVPWGRHTMIGTDYRLCQESPDTFRVQREDILQMLEEIRRVYPQCGLAYDNVTGYHAGLLPAASGDARENAEVQLEKNSSIVVHEQRQGAGLLSIKGVKYTTAPQIAEAAIARIRKLWKPRRKAERSPQEFRRDAASSVDMETARPPEETIDHFIDEEMAVTLSDVVYRRTNLGAARCPDPQILAAVADRMALRMGWTPKRKNQEIRDVMERYALLGSLVAEPKTHAPTT
jgi:glycerol-3-phosphate dehydrogenase